MVNFSARFTFNSQVVLQSLHRVYSVYKASNLDHLQGLVQEQHLPVGICLLLTFFVSIRVGAQNNSRVCESVCFSKGILKTRHTLEILNESNLQFNFRQSFYSRRRAQIILSRTRGDIEYVVDGIHGLFTQWQIPTYLGIFYPKNIINFHKVHFLKSHT